MIVKTERAWYAFEWKRKIVLKKLVFTLWMKIWHPSAWSILKRWIPCSSETESSWNFFETTPWSYVTALYVYSVCSCAPMKYPSTPFRINDMDVVWSCVVFICNYMVIAITHAPSSTACISFYAGGKSVEFYTMNLFICIYVTDGVFCTSSTEWSSMVFVCC